MRLLKQIVVTGFILFSSKSTSIHQYNSDVYVFEYNYLVKATCYNATYSQCDATPYKTASGAKINKRNPGSHRYVALSRDLIKQTSGSNGYNKKGPFKYGDVIVVSNAGPDLNGEWKVVDTMAKRHTNRIDFLINKGYHPKQFVVHSRIRIKRKEV